MNLGDIPKYLKYNHDLNGDIELLVDFAIDNSTLRFDKAFIGNSKLLCNANILKNIGGQITLEDTILFSHVLYEKYISLLKPKFSSDFNSFADFLKELEESFKCGKRNVGFYQIKNDVLTFAILEANAKFSIDFIKYVNSLVSEKKRDDIYSFIRGFSKTLPSLLVNPQAFLELCLILLNWTRNDNRHNLSSGELTIGIRNKISDDAEFGLEVFDSVVSTSNFDEDLLIPIITGMYNAKGISFYNSKLKPIVNEKEFTISIIIGLANVKEITEKEAKLFIILFEKFDKSIPENLNNLPKLLFSILKSKKLRRNSKYKRTCYSYLGELLSNDNSNLINGIIHEIWLLSDSSNPRFNLIIQLIKQPHFSTEAYLGRIDRFLFNLKMLSCFETLLNTIAIYHPYQEVYKFLNSSIREFQSEDKKKFDEIIVNLLINNKASYRFIGFDIFSSISQRNYSFDYDILELSPLNQYKLWVSVFADYMEPKKVIPCIIPLLKSKSTFIQESIVFKLEEYSENFGTEVLEVLNNNIPDDIPNFDQVVSRIDKYRSEYFRVNIQEKADVKELDPFYTQNKLLMDFSRSYSRKFNTDFQKASNKSSFLSMVASVKLLKGGGWKIEGKESISNLTEYKSSVFMPRNYMTEPEFFDFNRRVGMQMDWNEQGFLDFIKVFEDEQ